jgi:probable HAF family extracellular repeat protein
MTRQPVHCERLESRQLLATFYIITDLGTFGGNTSQAEGINERGEVVGMAQNRWGRQRAFLWTESGGLRNLGVLGESHNSAAQDINESGQVVGSSQDPQIGRDSQRAFLWTSHRGMIDLGTLPGVSGSSALAINDNYWIAGESGFRPAAWGQEQPFALSGTNGGIAWDVNKFVQVVGEEGGRPVVYQDGIRLFIPSVGTQTDRQGAALGINNVGRIVGYIDVGPADARSDHAFLYEFGMTKDLGSFGGNSRAQAINDQGIVVGHSWDTRGRLRAFVWSKPDGMMDLKGLTVDGASWRLESAQDINNKGQIVGYGINPSGKRHAFLLTPRTEDTDTGGPAASLDPIATVRTPRTAVKFSVRYADDRAIDVSRLNSQDIQVTGPGGFSRLARFLRVDQPTDGTPRIAWYSVTGPGGSWDRADNGLYRVILRSGQVGDTQGHDIPGRRLGSFSVNIPAPVAASLFSKRPIAGAQALEDSPTDELLNAS